MQALCLILHPNPHPGPLPLPFRSISVPFSCDWITCLRQPIHNSTATPGRLDGSVWMCVFIYYLFLFNLYLYPRDQLRSDPHLQRCRVKRMQSKNNNTYTIFNANALNTQQLMGKLKRKQLFKHLNRAVEWLELK